MTLKVLDSLFFCIPKQTEENDKLANQKIQKLESMTDLMIRFLKIDILLYFESVLL